MDHTTGEADSPQHADSVSSFHHGACADDAQSCDANEKSESHVADEQIEDSLLSGLCLGDARIDVEGFDAVLEEDGLNGGGGVVDAVPDVEEELRGVDVTAQSLICDVEADGEWSAPRV